jgi:carbon monoxide dehydrogenase subunit G
VLASVARHQLTRTSEDHYDGSDEGQRRSVTAAEFSVKVELKDKVAPEKFTMQIDRKGRSRIHHHMRRSTAGVADSVTVMDYRSDVQIGGRIAGVGQRLLESVGKMMAKQALDALQQGNGLRLGPQIVKASFVRVFQATQPRRRRGLARPV